MQIILSGVLCLLLSSPVQTTTSIVGKWSMFQVIQEGKDVSDEHNPFHERYFIINDDNTFFSGGRPYGENTGKYTFDSTNNTLFLDSDTGPEDDSHWIVSVNNDTMHWQGFGSAWAESFKIIQVRVKSE